MTAREALALWLEHLAHERRSSPRTLEAYGFAVAIKPGVNAITVQQTVIFQLVRQPHAD